jgi:hypothetical protein
MATIEPTHELDGFHSAVRREGVESSGSSRRERPSIERSVLAVLPVLVVAQLAWFGLLAAFIAYFFGLI